MTKPFIVSRISKLLVALGVMLAASLPAAAEQPLPLTCLLVPARTSNIVLSVDVTRADLVAKNDPLVIIDSEIAAADLVVARISIESLQERLGRSEGLLSRNLISRDEIGTLRTDLKLAVANEVRAQMELDRATIRAPFSGYVSEIGVSVGELIGPDPLLRLIDVSTLHAELVFLAAAYGQISTGDVLKVSVDLAATEVEAVVISIDPFIDTNSNAFTVLAEIANPDLVLPAGTTCDVID
jgi:membrane fusion protein (multidrug efflux system)